MDSVKRERLDKEDALIRKWKHLLPDWKITRRNSRNRRFVVGVATVLENQAKWMRKV